jgi:hypothetical protein
MDPTKTTTPSEVERSVALVSSGFETASILDLQIPDACRAGIDANFELLRQHARVVESFEYPDLDSPGDQPIEKDHSK